MLKLAASELARAVMGTERERSAAATWRKDFLLPRFFLGV